MCKSTSPRLTYSAAGGNKIDFGFSDDVDDVDVVVEFDTPDVNDLSAFVVFVDAAPAGVVAVDGGHGFAAAVLVVDGCGQ